MRRAHLVLALAPWLSCGEPSPEPATFAFEEPAEGLPPRPPRALPEPPSQGAPWEAPETSLPSPLVSAAEDLFAAGLADPRGGEYRKIAVTVGSVWGGSSTLETRGWVLPAPPGAPRFAVAWNGLVYEVARLGEPADLEADVSTLAETEAEARRTQAGSGGKFWRHLSALEERESAAHDRVHALMTPLLLRLGEARLAEKAWKAWVGPSEPGQNDRDFHPRDPYLLFATEWLWARLDRALTAHMRGDDPGALGDVRALEPAARAVERRARERKVSLAGLPERRGPFEYVDFLEPAMSALRRDQERRARGPRRLLPRPGNLRARKSFGPFAREYARAGVTAALVEQLDRVAARQNGQPGFVALGEDAIVEALAAAPFEAVTAALADALEKDERLTRSVHFHRDFFFHRSILGAHEAALAALEARLGASFFEAQATGDDLSGRGGEGRGQAAARVRAHLADRAR